MCSLRIRRDDADRQPEMGIYLAQAGRSSVVTIMVRYETQGGDDFEIYDRVAQHVRECADAPIVSPKLSKNEEISLGVDPHCRTHP